MRGHFILSNGDVELESIQVQDGYTLSATALKVNSPLGTTSPATIDTIKFTGASNGTYTLTSNLLAEPSVTGGSVTMNSVNAVRLVVTASIGGLVELVPQDGINMTTAETAIVGSVQQAPVNGIVTYQISMKKGWYPVISSDVKKPDGTIETIGVIATGNWTIPTTGGITAVPENDLLTWTVKITTNANSGKLALDCDAMPGAAIVNIPDGVTVDEPRSFVSLGSYTNKGVPQTFKAEFIVDVQEDYQLLKGTNCEYMTVEGWPNATKNIVGVADGSWSVQIASQSNRVGGAQVYLQSEPLHTVKLVVPDELKDHVTITGKDLGYAGSGVPAGVSTISATSFTVRVDDGWELTETDTWKQTDGNGLPGFANVNNIVVGPTSDKNVFTVTAGDVRGDAIITLGARESVSASAILRSNSGDIFVVEQDSVPAVDGSASFHVYVTNGMGIIKRNPADLSVTLKMVKDNDAARKDGMTAYVVTVSGIANRLVPVEVDVLDLIQAPLTANGTALTGPDGYIIAGRPGGAIMAASVYGYEATIIGSSGANSTHFATLVNGEIAVKDINVLKGYKPVGTSGIRFVEGSTTSDYTAWSVYVTPNAGDLTSSNKLDKDITRTFELVSR